MTLMDEMAPGAGRSDDGAGTTSATSRGRVRRTLVAGVRGLGVARAWLRAFRRTRPFWGGLWLMLGGVVVIRVMFFPLGLAMIGGFNTSAGYILGGALVLFGAVAWFAPHYSGLVGILGVLAALAAFVGANLGGFVLGTVLGIIGGSMVWGWGPKRPARRQRRRAALEADDTD